MYGHLYTDLGVVLSCCCVSSSDYLGNSHLAPLMSPTTLSQGSCAVLTKPRYLHISCYPALRESGLNRSLKLLLATITAWRTTYISFHLKRNINSRPSAIFSSFKTIYLTLDRRLRLMWLLVRMEMRQIPRPEPELSLSAAVKYEERR